MHKVALIVEFSGNQSTIILYWKHISSNKTFCVWQIYGTRSNPISKHKRFLYIYWQNARAEGTFNTQIFRILCPAPIVRSAVDSDSSQTVAHDIEICSIRGH